MSRCALLSRHLLWACSGARPAAGAAAAEAQYRLARPRPRSSVVASRSYSSTTEAEPVKATSTRSSEASTATESPSPPAKKHNRVRAKRPARPSRTPEQPPRDGYAFGGVPLESLQTSSLLQHFTHSPSQRKRLSVGPTIDALCVDADESQAQALRSALQKRGIEEATFLGWRNAVCEADWANACKQLSLDQYAAEVWPAFLVLRLLPLVSSAPQALHALNVTQRSLAEMQPLPATRAITLLIERSLLDLRCVHLAPQLTQLVLAHCKLMLSQAEPAKFVHPAHELLLRLLAALVRYADTRTRRCAERVLRGISKVQVQSRLLDACRTKQALARLALNMRPPTHLRDMGKKELADRKPWRDINGNARPARREEAGKEPVLDLLDPEEQEQKRRRHDVPWGSPPRLTNPLNYDARARNRARSFLTLPLATLALEHAGLEEDAKPDLTADGMRRIASVAHLHGETDVARAWLDELVQLRSATQARAALEVEEEARAQPKRKHSFDDLAAQRQDLALLASLGESDQAWSLFNSMLQVANANEESMLKAAEAARQAAGAAPLGPKERWQMRVQGRLVAPNAWDWRAVVGMAARDVSVDPMGLLRYLRLYKAKGEEKQGENEEEESELRMPRQLFDTPALYADLMANFARRPRQPLGAIMLVWSVMRKRGVRPDAGALATYCKALMHGNQTHEALRLLVRFVALDGKHVAREGEAEKEMVLPTTQLFNILLQGLHKQGQHLAVWKLYSQTLSTEDVARRISVSPDAATLSILLRSAAAAGHGFIHGESARDAAAIAAGVRRGDRVRARTAAVLWDDVPAPQRARQVLRDALLKQHPELVRCESALKQASKAAGWAWRGEMRMRQFEAWIQRRLHGLVGSAAPRGEAWETYMDAPRAGAARRVATRQSVIVFDAIVFDDYLHLLRFRDAPGADGAQPDEGNADEVFHVLAWMRALHLEPSADSLCLVCLKLAEITPPSLYGAGEADSAAGILQEWLEDWLGPEAVPSIEEVGEYGRREHQRWHGALREEVVTQSG